jgi:O-acetyl-ADP-ribose deacetylase (regulator of RNase III)
VTAEVLHREVGRQGGEFLIVRGNLLDEPVDAVVNAANGRLAHGGGVAGVLSRAAGPALQAESDRLVRERGPLPTGSAARTGAGRLRFRGVVHAIGPRQGEGEEGRLLLSALTAAFEEANAAGWASLSFPAVSSGIFAVPLEVCARAYVRAARDWLARSPVPVLRTLRLCLRDQPVSDAVLAELRRA